MIVVVVIPFTIISIIYRWMPTILNHTTTSSYYGACRVIPTSNQTFYQQCYQYNYGNWPVTNFAGINQGPVYKPSVRALTDNISILPQAKVIGMM